jgi:hypothetical protein
MFAVPMAQIAQTFTGALHGRIDSDMVERPETQAVNGKTTAANRARDLCKGVERHLWTFADAQYADFLAGRSKQPNRLLAAHAIFRM